MLQHLIVGLLRHLFRTRHLRARQTVPAILTIQAAGNNCGWMLNLFGTTQSKSNLCRREAVHFRQSQEQQEYAF
ncbi:hypothetical protein [Chitinibacter sp. S2-10]|uniref:hypothetical protein n=1 Tax=Chitinibacter sp. S2-10 TaxID=3373597 RepID=UPI003977691B